MSVTPSQDIAGMLDQYVGRLLDEARAPLTAEVDRLGSAIEQRDVSIGEQQGEIVRLGDEVGRLKAEVERLTPKPTPDPGLLDGWGLPVFRDEFDGDAVDRSRWNVRDGQGNSNEQSWLLARNVTVADGKLRITAKREAVGGRAYSSGYVDSIGKHSQRYGLWQVRARTNNPPGRSQGMWAAPLWLRGNTSPMEIDLIETWGTGAAPLSDNAAGIGSGSIHQNTNGGGGKRSNWAAPRGMDLSADFHTYECEWASDFIALRRDGVEFVRATPTNAPWAFGPDFAGAANMRVNLQVVKEGAPYGAPTIATELPSTLEIDWIRVYAR